MHFARAKYQAGPGHSSLEEIGANQPPQRISLAMRKSQILVQPDWITRPVQPDSQLHIFEEPVLRVESSGRQEYLAPDRAEAPAESGSVLARNLVRMVMYQILVSGKKFAGHTITME